MIENLIDGPLWYFSLAVFAIGVVWRLASIIFASRKQDLSVARGAAGPAAVKTVFSRFVPHKEIASQITVPIVAGYMFHLGLFALLFFAAPHVVFLEENLLGFGWTPMPHWAFIIAAQQQSHIRTDYFAYQKVIIIRVNFIAVVGVVVSHDLQGVSRVCSLLFVVFALKN